MPVPATQMVPAFVPEALAASQVGTWDTDFVHNQVMGDATTATLFDVDPHEAAQGVPLAAYVKAIHPADRVHFDDAHASMRERGGLFVVEYRTYSVSGQVRWILARGRFAFDPALGGMRGRGIVIDITESKLDGHVEDRAFFLAADEDGGVAEQPPLDAAATHAIAAREAIDRVEGADWPELRKAVDALLWAVGRALARRG